MAVIKGVKVAIVSGGQELKEYSPPKDKDEKNNIDKDEKNDIDKANGRVTYIEATSEAKFQVRCELRKNFHFNMADCVVFEIHMDGKVIGGPLCPKPTYQRDGRTYERTYDGQEVYVGTCWQLHPFQWGKLRTDDRCISEEDKKQYQDKGIIRVEVWRKFGGPTEKMASKPDLGTGKVIPEKAVKGEGVNLEASFGEPQTSTGTIMWDATPFDTEPYAIFVFKYRTKEVLQVLDIIKKPKTEVPLEDRDREKMSKKELLELISRQEDAEKAKIKKEKIEANKAQFAEFKRRREEEADDDDDMEILEARHVKVKKVCTVAEIIDDSD